jgi:uroporphyrin-III C-methyltransferase
LILGSNSLAASRAFSALEADSQVVIIAKGGRDNACEELRWRASQNQLTLLDWDALPGTSAASTDRDIKALESYLSTTDGITLVCVTDTVISGDPTQARSWASATQIYRLCQGRNILVNVSDMPEFCDFSFTSVHRFVDPESGQSTPLQVATTTNGQGCRLAGRIRREIVAKLPKEVGAAVEKMGKLRTMAKASDRVIYGGSDSELNEDNGVATPNLPVPLRGSTETSSETALRRMKWVAQVSEYWPLPRLATMTEEDMQNVLSSEGMEAGSEVQAFSGGILSPSHKGEHSIHSLTPVASSLSNGKILLVGSGPGHPSLLTLATHNALTKHAHLVLSDKLVPAAVLALIPAEVEVRIARKFPGNAEGAQIEMMEAAVEAARRGLTVIRVSPLQPH